VEEIQRVEAAAAAAGGGGRRRHWPWRRCPHLASAPAAGRRTPRATG
jgi:hypothetical protein